ncbi:hypothetical protein GIB67_036316 [Kingdonia uniflora]|uniref:non-specific serine/threonine protein kinase n=1 Tax=Kingdonia uniflora TaxID=39325 RepID=A0A7J7L3X7_9MAGN|nr:hypothetical protein GIB67_036316 [Kingdonia uniflora]
MEQELEWAIKGKKNLINEKDKLLKKTLTREDLNMEIEMGVENYHVIELVGEGSFGKVYKGRRKYTGQTVAMKFILKHGKSEKDLVNLRQEIEILRKLKHENIIEMLDSFETPQEFCVVTEFAQGELFEIIEDDKCLPEEQVQAIAKQLVRALHYLHSNRIIHRDMKPQNILIGSGSIVKLCDFGFARLMSMNTVVLRSIKGTPLYMAPELVRTICWPTSILYKFSICFDSSHHQGSSKISRQHESKFQELSERVAQQGYSPLLVKPVPQNRLTWPALLEHPFVKETSVDRDARELRATTAPARGCHTAWRGEANNTQTLSMGCSTAISKVYPTTPEKNNVCSPLSHDKSEAIHNSSTHEETVGGTAPNDIQSGCQMLDSLEGNSHRTKGANSICEKIEVLAHILRPLKTFSNVSPNSCREQDVLCVDESFRMLSNFLEAGSLHSGVILDDIISELLRFTTTAVGLKSSDGVDLAIKSVSILRKLVDAKGSVMGSLYELRINICWSSDAMGNRLIQLIMSYPGDVSGRLLYESTACIAIMVTFVAQVLKKTTSAAALKVDPVPSAVEEVSKQILGHAKATGVVDLLSTCLEIAGSSLLSGSSSMSRTACEACRAIWALINAQEILSTKKHAHLFPLHSFRTHSLLRPEVRDARSVLLSMESTEIVDVVTRALIRSKAVQVSIYYCFHQRLESAMFAGFQVVFLSHSNKWSRSYSFWLLILQALPGYSVLLLRCCLHSGSIAGALCGLPYSLPVATIISGGSDGTVVSEIFSILFLCASSSNNESLAGKEASNKKFRASNICSLVMQSCLLLATIAQCLKLAGRASVSLMLTTVREKQLSRLSVLIHFFCSYDTSMTSLQPVSASAMLALASILSLESRHSLECPIFEIALPLIPPIATLCGLLSLPCNQNGMLSHWHGLRDGFVGLIEIRIKWGGPLAVQQACANQIPRLLICLLNDSLPYASQGTDKTKDQVGISPIGVVWTVSVVCHCLSGGISAFREILVKTEHVRLIQGLLSEVHIEMLKCWNGPGGGNTGVKDLINEVIDLLAYPFVVVHNVPVLPSATASIISGFLLNSGSPGGRVGMEDRDTVKAIDAYIPMYIQILVEVGVPVSILRCLEDIELKDSGRPVAFLAKMIGYQPGQALVNYLLDCPRNPDAIKTAVENLLKKLSQELLEEGLLHPTRLRRFFDGISPKEVVVDMLMIVSNLARMDKDFYDYLDKVDLLVFLKGFLSHKDSIVCAKACNVVGNMCRRSPYFYNSLAEHDIITVLIDRCADQDKRTRKFACFAVGNAAFHNDMLYEELRRAIPVFVNLLHGAEEERTKSNAAGALCNLVRNSNQLCGDMITNGAMQASLKLVRDYSALALSPSKRFAVKESPLLNALTFLWRMCAYSPCQQFLLSSDLLPVICPLQQSTDSDVAKCAYSIIRRLSPPNQRACN